MDLNRDDLNRLRALLDMMQSTAGTSGSDTPAGNGSGNHINSEPAAAAHGNTPVTAYQSMRITGVPSAPLGHPATPGSTPATSRPFLGLEHLGVNLRPQVNQRRLASSSQSGVGRTRPRPPARGRGPAIHAPTLPRVTTPKIEDCLLGDINNSLRLKIKVYPPKVCGCFRIGCSKTTDT